MKQKLLFLLTALLLSVVAIAQEPYAVLSNSNTILKFYYDKNKDTRGGMSVGPFASNADCGWYSVRTYIVSVLFDDTFSECSSLTSTARWFNDCSNLTTISGIENLKTDNVTNMSYMFSGCSGLTSLNLSGFNTQNVTNMRDMFYGCSGLTSLNLSGFNTQNVTNMRNMFSGCSGLTSLNLSGFNTKNVTDMSWMFYGCSGLTSLNLSGFNTKNVTDMSRMFYGCSGLKNLDLRSFNTLNVTDMSWMFYDCSGLTSLDLSSLNTSSVTNMYRMFEGCSSLTSLDMSSLNTANVTNMSSMLCRCKSLTSLDVSGFNTQNVTDMSWMFRGCSGLMSLNLSNFNTVNVTNMASMFYGCAKLNTIYVGSGWSTAAVIEGSDLFLACWKLVGGQGTEFQSGNDDYIYAHIDEGADNPGYLTDIEAPEPYAVLSNDNTVLTFYYDNNKLSRGGMSVGPFVYIYADKEPNTSWYAQRTDITTVKFDESIAGCTSITSTYGWFYGCTKITSIIDIKNLKTDNVTNMSHMFYHCTSLTSLDVSGFNTANVTDMSAMFRDCSKISSLDVSGFNTAKVTNMSYMFNWCPSLKSLDVSGFKTENVTEMDAMFDGCESLTSLDVSGFKTDNVTKMEDMFYGCKSLTSLDVSGFKTDNVTIMAQMFSNCSSLASLDVSNFNTANVTYLGAMFNGCSGLTSLDLSSFNTSNVKDMEDMFNGCSSLTTIYVGDGWSTEKVTDGDNMFSRCTSLIGGKGTEFNSNNTDYSYAHIDGGSATPGYLTDINAPNDHVTLTAKSYSRVYGDANPTFEYMVTSGTITSGTPTITCSASTTSPVGTYDIVIAQGTVSNSSVELVKGTLTITKAPLTISAGNYYKVEDEDNPSFKAIYSGFKNGETETVLTKKPTITTTATMTSPAGEYPVTVSGAEARNYEIGYQNGTLTITNPVEVEVTDVSSIDNVIYIEPIEETKGSEVVVPILMKNTTDIRGFQFDLYLPKGVSLAKTPKGKFVSSLSSGRLPEEDEHTLTIREQEDGALRFLCGSQYNEIFTGNEGEIATMKLLIAEDMAEGKHPIVLKKVKLSETDISNYYYTETVQTSLTIVTYVSGDISGDGEIDVTDYIGVANFILGDKPEGFVEAAADVNKDKVVDVSDYIGVANIILFGNIYGPVANASRGATQLEKTNSSASDNLIYIEPFKADANSQATVSFKMKNTADIRGFQFDVYLPNGISVVKDAKNRIKGLLTSNRKPIGDQHTLTLSEQQDGAIRFLCASMNDETFTDSDGEVATLTVNIAGDMIQGDYPILLKKMKLSETNIGNCYETESRMATITINNNSATGIEQLTTGSGNETYYNLQGQRVNTPAKGVFVKNGKKVMMK